MITNLFAWNTAVGVVVGFMLSRLWCLAKVEWLERHKPLPGGRRRSRWAALAVDPRYIAAVVAVAFLVWSVFQTQANADEQHRAAAEAKAFAELVADCQRQFNEALRARGRINDENDGLSMRQRELLIEKDDALDAFVRAWTDPPNDIAELPSDSPRRVQYLVDIARAYVDASTRIRSEIAVTQTEQRSNEKARPPYPEPTCGR